MEVLAFWKLDPELQALADADSRVVLGSWRHIIRQLSENGVLPFTLTDDNLLQAVRGEPIIAIAVVKGDSEITLHILFRTCSNEVSVNKAGHGSGSLSEFGAVAELLEFERMAPIVNLLTRTSPSLTYREQSAAA